MINAYSKTSYVLKDINKNFIFKLDINNKKKFLSILKKYKPKAFLTAAETHVDRSIIRKEFINSNIVGVFNLQRQLGNIKK